MTIGADCQRPGSSETRMPPVMAGVKRRTKTAEMRRQPACEKRIVPERHVLSKLDDIMSVD
jgi:hypothetical protein